MTSTIVTSGQSIPNLTASGGDLITVLSGGTVTAASILPGGSAVISGGGVDSGSTIAAGGAELVYGSANGDVVAGLQTVSTGSIAGLVTNETVVGGGVVLLSVKTTSAANTTIDSGGALNINGAISAFNTVLSGGTVDLESAKATLTGSLVFAGGGTLAIAGNTSAGSGDLATISGFGAGDVIDITAGTTIGAAAGATLTTAISGGDTVATVSGGGLTDTYVFAGASIGATLALIGDGAGGREIVTSGSAMAVTSVGSGATVSNVVVSSGSPLTVYNGGTIVSATILSGGLATISAGGLDSSGSVLSGGSETLLGSAANDAVAGSQTLAGATATATGETIQSGGVITLAASGASVSGTTVGSGATLNVSGGGTAVNTVITGGTVDLQLPTDTLSGSLAFNGPGALDIASLAATGAGDQAPITGFYTGDVVNILPFGSGTTLSTATSGGVTVATVTSGIATETLLFSGTAPANLALSISGGVAQIDYAGPPTTTAYTPGDLVLSIYGDGSGTGVVSLDQAAPITLEEITQTGQIVSVQELPQATTVVNGVTEYAISGEYESASEGILTLSADGRSLTIMGYGVTAANFDAANAATVYGTTALGQTTSLLGGQYTAVERIIADIGFNGVVDTSTSLSGVFNTNNPRSVFTINGTTFYIGGQGNGADGTEGVFLANDGASNATAIYNTKTDVRAVQIVNGQLYVSIDSKLNGGGALDSFGATLPTLQTTPTALPGVGSSIVLTAAQANSVNAGAVGASVNLSPEQYFFANATTLYVADGGVPKEGGIGDGGLQKWVFANGAWTLEYTLSTGLNMVANTGTTGTSGLVGLTGTIEGGNVVLYASNETIAETDQTYLYGITDALAATAPAVNESFTLLETAAPGTLIRGVAFAPTASSTTPVVSGALTVSGGVASTGLTIGSGGTITVLSGGTIAGTTLLSGASAVINSGGVDSATFVAHGAAELLLGSAALDIIDGAQILSNATAVASGEIVENGGSLDLFLKGAIANGATVNTRGGLFVSGNAFAVNTVVNGGSVVLESAKAVISGGLTFIGSGGVLEEPAIVSGGGVYGNLATISGFGAGDAIDERAFASGVLTTAVSGGNVLATITSGGSAETFNLAGSAGVSGAAYASGLALINDNSGGVEITYAPPAPVDIIVSSGVTSSGLTITSNNIITVLSGGTISAITVLSGGSAVVSAGGEASDTIVQAGGSEIVEGDAQGEQIYGVQNVTTGPSAGALPATVENETVFNGGTIELYLKPDVGTNITVSSGGSLLLSGNVSATNTTLEAGGFMALQSPKAVINGSLVFNGAATIDVTAVTSGGFGDLGVISGFGPGDVIDETLTSAGAATLTTTTNSDGNTVETISGATSPDSFIFVGTAIASNIALAPDGLGGVELAYQAACLAEGTRVMTASGEVAIERLAVGDRVLTASGALRPVVWTGWRSVAPRRHPNPSSVNPVRVRAGAFGDNCPSRDLLLSPDHAVFAEGALIPARWLVNGESIVLESVERITWWHVELETHDVIIAEGLATETYLDTGNRTAFTNADATQLHPNFARNAAIAWSRHACAPLVEDGPILERVRARLAARIHADMPEIALSPGRVRATVLGNASTVRLTSPARRKGDDRRRLGALIRGLRIDGVAAPLDDPRLGLGFHEMERHGAQTVRWTDGAANLSLGVSDRPRLIEVDVAALAEPADAAA